tara:strand:+ start:83 stop:1291 length:1209 start_codon:yes stop_codon:yes gene_type:complete
MGIGNRTNEYGQVSDKPSEGNFRDQFPVQKKVNNESRTNESAKVNKTKGYKSFNRIPKGGDSSKYYSYPLARGPAQETGDTLLIKCVKYVTMSTETGSMLGLQDFSLTKGVAANENGEGYVPPKVTTPGVKNGSFKALNFGATADARTRQNQQIQYYVELPIPQDINDTSSVTWGEDSMNMIQLAGLAIGRKFINSPASLLRDAQEVLTGGITIPGLDPVTQESFKAAISGKAINQLGANVNPRNVVSRATGQVLNSNLELLFQGVNLRSFPFSITFSPRSEAEGGLVKDIIRSLKRSMLAKATNSVGNGGFSGAAAEGIMISAPDVFLLEYRSRGRVHPFLNAFKTCALTGLNVNYTNSGTYATYDNSTPVNIRMDMTFKELNPIYAEDYDSPDAGPGVGY